MALCVDVEPMEAVRYRWMQEDSVGVGPVPGRGEGYRVDGTGSHLEQGGGEGRASGR